MVKDYARRDPIKRPYRHTSHTKPTWLPIVMGILLGACIATAFCWHFFKKTPLTFPATNTSEPYERSDIEPLKKQTKKTTSAKPSPETRFDFYTVLPNTDTPAVSPIPDITPKPNEPSPTFIVQAGSFDTADAADSLKAQLTLQGLEPQTHAITNDNGQTTYQVSFGPFQSEQDALIQHHVLNDNGIPNTIILKSDK